MPTQPTILIIDDNETDGWIAERIIKKYDQQVNIQVYNNAGEALRYLQVQADISAGQTYIILLDIYMPDMDGWQFLEEYLHLPLQTQAAIHLYMHSSSISPADRRRAGGFIQIKKYISKPLVGGDLKQLLSDPLS